MLQTLAAPLDVSTVREDVALAPGGLDFNRIRPQSSMTDLIGLRAQFPFLEIAPFPSTILSAFLAKNVPTEFQLPSGTKLIRFKGSGGYFVSNQGNAIVPAANPPQPFVSPGAGNGLYMPEDYWFYVTSMRAVSIVAVNDNTYVSVSCWIPETELSL